MLFHVIPRKTAETTDKLYKMAFYKSDVYYSYLTGKGKTISEEEMKELFNYRMAWFSKGQ